MAGPGRGFVTARRLVGADRASGDSCRLFERAQPLRECISDSARELRGSSVVGDSAPSSYVDVLSSPEDVHGPATQRAGSAVGRESELAALNAFFEDGNARAFVLMGGPGIGKTTLWEVGIEFARMHGWRVLSARASGADARLSFAALIDLLDGVETEELVGLPAPQLRALEVALLRAEPEGAPPEPHAIALGFLNTLRALAAREPLLVAIDDVQWLDPPSADALDFVVRRLEGEPVGFLLAKRPGLETAFESALERRALGRLEVGPLSLGATRRILSERLGLSLTRQLLRRIHETTLGNPLFALEVGRTLAGHGLPAVGEELPVPDSVEDLLGTRVERLPGPVRRLLLVVALSAELRTSQVAAITGPDALHAALDAGVVLVDDDRVRASHPLLAAAARSRSHPANGASSIWSSRALFPTGSFVRCILRSPPSGRTQSSQPRSPQLSRTRLRAAPHRTPRRSPSTRSG